MDDKLSNQPIKRNVAYKFKVGQILGGKQIVEEDRLLHLEIIGKRVVRVNLIANAVDKYVQEGEKKYATVTLDDGTGQIKVKFFGDEVVKAEKLNQGDTLLVVGLLRSWNNELYISPEIIKKKEPAFLLVRKLECELEMPKEFDKNKIAELKDTILGMVKGGEENGGIDIDKIIMDLKEPPDVINSEIRKLLEDGVAYEPRPGKLRYLG